MIRVLVMIAVTGFLVSVVTLSTAVAIGGPEFLSDGAWGRWGPWEHGRWNFVGDEPGWGYYGHHYRREGETGPQATREMAWTGGDTLEVDIPADITYTQAPGPGKLIITGSQRALDALELNGGRLESSHHHGRWADVTIVMTAPAVSHFEVRGSNDLVIEGYKQDKLTLDLSGHADVKVKGEARALDLTISGAADTDLSDLKVTDAEVEITGAGQATLAPTGSANLNISGSGDVTLLSRPAKLESHVSGSGSVHQGDAITPTPSPSPSPSPSPKRGRI